MFFENVLQNVNLLNKNVVLQIPMEKLDKKHQKIVLSRFEFNTIIYADS